MDIKNLVKSANNIKDYLSIFNDGMVDDELSQTITTNPKDLYFNKNKNLRKADAKIPLTDNQIDEIIKCRNDIFYFAKYIKIRVAKKGIIPLELRDFQINMINSYLQSKRVVTVASRQVGKTTVDNLYVFWYAWCNSNQNIWILANKGKTAKSILRKIKVMIESLPLWMQQGIVAANLERIEFENGTVINASTTTSESARSEDISLLVLDEFGRIPRHIEDDFIESVFPTVSSDLDSQMIIVSTPNGISNTFSHIYHEAVNNNNEYTHHSYDWTVVPGRDEEWKLERIKEFKGDERKFLQEYCCAFLGSSKTLINTELLKSMKWDDPINKDDLDFEHYKVYKSPIENRRYICIADIAKGKNRTASTIQVIDITEIPFEQVARYENRKIDTYDFSLMIDKVAKIYNDALIIPENNGIGESVCQLLVKTLKNENVVFAENGDIGLNTSLMSKNIGASEVGILIEKNLLVLRDYKTISQLKTFVKTGNVWGPDGDALSDLIMPIVIFGYAVNNTYVRTEYLKYNVEDIYGDSFNVQSDDIEEFENEIDDTYGIIAVGQSFFNKKFEGEVFDKFFNDDDEDEEFHTLLINNG